MSSLSQQINQMDGKAMMFRDSLTIELSQLIHHEKQHKPKEESFSFEYDDEDCLEHELSEIYSYAEYQEFNWGKLAYEEVMKIQGYKKGGWVSLDLQGRCTLIIELLDMLESANKIPKEKSTALFSSHELALRALLYISQGVQHECLIPSNQIQAIRANNILLKKTNAFPIFVQGLIKAAHLGSSSEDGSNDNNSSSNNNNNNLAGINDDDLEGDLGGGSSKLKKLSTQTWDTFMGLYLNLLFNLIELNQDDKDFSKEVADSGFILTMLELVGEYNDREGNIFPIKKILLVLWKTVLFILGGTDTIRKRKEEYLKKIGYDLDGPKCRYVDVFAVKQDAERSQFDVVHGSPKEIQYKNENGKIVKERLNLRPGLAEAINLVTHRMYPPLNSRFGGWMWEGNSYTEHFDPTHTPRALLPPEETSLFEKIYNVAFPGLPKYFIVLMKILLAAAPTIKNYTGSINLLCETVPNVNVKMPITSSQSSVVSSMQSAVDLLRHREIISKATSAILLLLLKHAMQNHTPQAIHLCHVMVEAKGILLILKLLNTDINQHLSSKSYVEGMEFLDKDKTRVHKGRSRTWSKDENYFGDEESKIGTKTNEGDWRNFFTVVNLLRILQKLTKRNPLALKVVLQYKAPNILKKMYSTRHSLIQYYTLKMYKSLVPYMTKKWRQSNMKIISDIYCKVRIDVRDEWLNSELMDGPAIINDPTEYINDYLRLNYIEWYLQTPSFQKTSQTHISRPGPPLIYNANNLLGLDPLDLLLEEEDEKIHQEEESVKGKFEIDEKSSLWVIRDNTEDEILTWWKP